MFWALFVLLPVFLVALWLLIVGFLAYLGGWRRLAKFYRDDDIRAEDVNRSLHSVTLGRWGFPRVHYRNVLKAKFASDRLLIRTHILFRWAHPPLCIPKAHVRAQMRKGYLRRYAEISMQVHPGITFHMPAHEFRWPEVLEQVEV